MLALPDGLHTNCLGRVEGWLRVHPEELTTHVQNLQNGSVNSDSVYFVGKPVRTTLVDLPLGSLF